MGTRQFGQERIVMLHWELAVGVATRAGRAMRAYPDTFRLTQVPRI